MKNKLFYAAVLLLTSLFVSACATSGVFNSVNTTNVDLRQPNYKIVGPNLTGESEAGYILGFTLPNGVFTHTLALARVSGTGTLYHEAISNLWKNFESKYGPVEGKRLALANVRYDSDALNLFFYTGVKIYIRADVVEFE